MKIVLTIFCLMAICFFSFGQNSDVFFKGAIKANRDNLYKMTIEKSIQKNLNLSLTDSTEENWQTAFNAIALLNYKTDFVQKKIDEASKLLNQRSVDFQKSFWSICYKRFPIRFFQQAKKTFDTTHVPKLMALCGEYIIADENKLNYAKRIFEKIEKDAKADTALLKNPFYISLAMNARIALGFAKETPLERSMSLLKWLPFFLDVSYLQGNTIVYSFQRKNRNFPGLAVVRNATVGFVKNSDSSIFNVPQLARSMYNLPSYITNGNTPQGIFRMKGIGVSTLSFIGTTENLQLMLPVEATKQHFFKDSLIAGNDWDINDYKSILPKQWRKNTMLYEAYFAGLAGRNDIIAHGTTLNPNYYKGTTYYPHTPTEGCLCSKEIWSEVDGKRLESNQQKLVNAVKLAGGADGYLIVIEIEDEQRAVTLKDIEPYLKMAKNN